jgi:hypothetical protein
LGDPVKGNLLLFYKPLGDPKLSTRIEAFVDIKLFSGAVAGEVR